MVYVMGILGFLGGFIFGIMLLHFLLRHKSRAELLSDQSLKWKFGILNWGMAALGAYAFVYMYQFYFGVS